MLVVLSLTNSSVTPRGAMATKRRSTAGVVRDQKDSPARGPGCGNTLALAPVQDRHLPLIASKGGAAGSDLRRGRPELVLQIVEDALVVAVDSAEAVTQQMQLVLKAQRGRIAFAGHRKLAPLPGTVGHEAAMREA